jgi:hypothetical protein
MNSPRGAAFSVNMLWLTPAVLAIGNGAGCGTPPVGSTAAVATPVIAFLLAFLALRGFKLQWLGTFVGFGTGMRRGPGKTMYRFGQPARSTRRRRRPAASIRQACRARMNGVGSLA